MNSSSLILGIDTSCDETSAAVVADGTHILSNIVLSQVKLHAPHGGVVPELASRSHLEMLPIVVRLALDDAQIALNNLTGIAVTNTPGLIGCLLVGLSYAKSLGFSLNIPVAMVHHLKAHLFSPFLEHPPIFPFLGLVVSGGHTALYHVKNFDEIECLGQTVDDAAGEAYDKVGKLLGVGYPGGPILDRLAKEGNPDAFHFTRARVKKNRLHFSFSGLKTAVALLVRAQDGTGPATPCRHGMAACRYPARPRRSGWPRRGPQPPTAAGPHWGMGAARTAGGSLGQDPLRLRRDREPSFRRHPFHLENQLIRDIAASFQREAIGSLVEKIDCALDAYPAKAVLASGGVACNSLLREEIKILALKRGIDHFIPSPLLCTDNGAMIASVGDHQLSRGFCAPLDSNAFPSAPMW